jgi:hypothetical protein
MPMKLTVGFSRKLGLPGYSSLGASCQIERELDGFLLDSAPDEFRHKLRQTYAACAEAVEEELSRHRPIPPHGVHHREPRQAGSAVPGDNGQIRPDESDRNGSTNRPNGPSRRKRPATPAQLRALRALAGRLCVDLDRVLQEAFHVASPEDLSVADASQLIDRMRAMAQAPPAPDSE